MNFYETLRLEVKDEVGVTIATHGWIGAEITGGKLMLEEGAEMQWKEEREVSFHLMCCAFFVEISHVVKIIFLT